MRTLRLVTLSVGMAAGTLALTALASATYAQTIVPQLFWQGAPNATAPDASVEHSDPAPGPSGPYYGDGPVANGPYWLGAPKATGPSE
jgi:hypothetical protein